MKVEIEIDTQELINEIVQEVVDGIGAAVSNKTASSKTDVLFTVKSLTEYLSVSDQWVYERVKFKEIPHVKMGKHLRFKKKEIDLWLDSQRVPPVNKLSSPLRAVK